MSVGRIKIAHVITRMDKGGAPDMVRVLVRGLDPARYDVTLIFGVTRDPSQATKAFIKKLGERAIVVLSLVRPIRPIQDLGALIRLVILFRKERFDIVHLHTAKAGFLGRLAARLAGVPVVIYSTHGHVFYGYGGRLASRIFIWLERLARRWCQCIHVFTQKEKQDLLAYRVAEDKTVCVIPSGLEKFDYSAARQKAEAVKMEFGIAPHDWCVGMIGRLEPVKGPDQFVYAAVRVLQKLPGVRFLVAGDGTMRSSLESMVKEGGLEDKIKFTGWREDIAPLIGCLDVLVVPSLNEAVGHVIIEAQFMGVSVVATRVGGVPEVVIDGETGILVPPAEPNDLADAVISLLKDEARRLAMGQAGRRWAEGRFTDTAMVQAFDQLYQSLIAKKGQE